MPNARLTTTDGRILELLQQNARLSNITLAERVSLSPSACLRRVRSLEKRGLIRHYVTLLDSQQLGLGISVFIQVSLEKKDQVSLKRFERVMTQRPEVMECYLMTGDSDYLLRVVVPNLAAYEQFLMHHLTRVRGIANIRSSFALRWVKSRTALPLGHLET